jgi:hypothetical protein
MVGLPALRLRAVDVVVAVPVLGDLVLLELVQAQDGLHPLDVDAGLVVVVGACDGHAVHARADLGAQDGVGLGPLAVAEVDVGLVSLLLGHAAPPARWGLALFTWCR